MPTVRESPRAEERALREFTACSNYPACKYVKQKTIGVKCPGVFGGRDHRAPLPQGQDLLRLQPLSRMQFVAWGKPVAEKCPDCGSPYMVEKWLKPAPCGSAPIRVQTQAAGPAAAEALAK